MVLIVREISEEDGRDYRRDREFAQLDSSEDFSRQK